jgi:hypothetical protein
MSEFLSEINSQPADIQQLIVPTGTGIHNNSDPSLPPNPGALAYDEVIPGALFIGTGVVWDNVFPSSGVIGPGTSVVGDIATWANTEGTELADSGILASKVVITDSSSSADGNVTFFDGSSGKQIQDMGIQGQWLLYNDTTAGVAGNIPVFTGVHNVVQDSGMIPADVVTNTSSVTAGDLLSFTGTGNVAQDSGISITATTVTGVTFTSNSGLNPDFTGCVVSFQRITVGSIVTVLFSIAVNQTITATSAGDFWQSGNIVPAGYNASQLTNIAATFNFPNPSLGQIQLNGNTLILIPDASLSGSFELFVLPGTYFI